MQKLVFSFALTILAAFSISTCCAEAQTVSLDAVLKDCEQRTIVMGRAEDGKMVRVGERIGGFCKGILEGMIAVLVRTGTICVKDKDFLRIFAIHRSDLSDRDEIQGQ
jgi:hypothetical protein